jgi:hypothetical protein
MLNEERNLFSRILLCKDTESSAVLSNVSIAGYKAVIPSLCRTAVRIGSAGSTDDGDRRLSGGSCIRRESKAS